MLSPMTRSRSKPTESTAKAPSVQPSEGVRTVASLMLFIHLFCVAVVLSSNFIPSPLQQKLVAVVSPYTKSLHLDPNFVPFQLTSGDEGFGQLHQWQVIENGKIIHQFPHLQHKAGFQRLRHDMYARVGGYYGIDDALDDEVPAAMANALAKYVFTNRQGDGNRLLLRCVRYVEDPDSVSDKDNVTNMYEADVWLTKSGQVNLLKRTEARRSAPPVGTKVD